MQTPKVSIIVPVYNAEPYLRRCLDSILAQTFPDFEAILVDDGSTDGSGAICEEYAARDTRFTVVHQSNSGVGGARQTGLKIAQKTDSTYCIHADPDDWVEEKWLEMLVHEAEKTKSEMVICDFFNHYEDRARHLVQNPMTDNPYDTMKLLFHGLHGSLCNKLVLKSCFRDYSITFQEGINYCEDFIVVLKLLMHIRKVSYVPYALYNYNLTNMNSYTRTPTMEAYFIRKRSCDVIAELLPDELKSEINYMAYDNKLFALRNGFLTKKEYYGYRPTPLKVVLRYYRNSKYLFFGVLAWMGAFKSALTAYHYLTRK